MGRVWSIILCLALVASPAWAQTTAKKDGKLRELVSLMNVDAMIDDIYTQMEVMMQNMSAQLGVQPAEQPTFDEYHNKLMLVIREEMSWAKMEPEMLKIYAANFTDAQIDDLITFYKSPTGRALVEKLPAINRDAMQMGQAMMAGAMPKVQKIVEDLTRDLEASRKKAP